jgi:phenylacetate-CoA ligase
MNDALVKLYHLLPVPLRSLAASLRGYHLRTWRYGKETNQLVAEALQRESWTTEQWEAWKRDRLAYVLRRAATHVPFYREQWAERRRRGDRAAVEELRSWPVLEKETLRTHARHFVANDCRLSAMYHEHTSGTTGKSIDIWWNRQSLRSWYALCEARMRCWHGISRHDRWAILGGQLVAPVSQQHPPFWIWNSGLSQLYMSSYHLAPQFIPSYLEALRAHRVVYLLGYTSALYSLAREVVHGRAQRVPLRVVITNAEPVYQYQRETISDAFQCPVRETYGMAEAVTAASECPQGRLHLWPSVGVVEVLDGEEPVAYGRPGELVCTSLLNADMPLIRYRVGDRGALDTSGPCACGRNLPALSFIEGRSDDTLYTATGGRVGRLDPIFKAHLPIREAQIIQESLSQVRIRYVPAPEFGPADAHSLVDRLRARMGSVEVFLEPVEAIPRTARGKFQAVVCRLPQDLRRQLDRAN